MGQEGASAIALFTTFTIVTAVHGQSGAVTGGAAAQPVAHRRAARRYDRTGQPVEAIGVATSTVCTSRRAPSGSVSARWLGWRRWVIPQKALQ